jgi:hypothetical protein
MRSETAGSHRQRRPFSVRWVERHALTALLIGLIAACNQPRNIPEPPQPSRPDAARPNPSSAGDAAAPPEDADSVDGANPAEPIDAQPSAPDLGEPDAQSDAAAQPPPPSPDAPAGCAVAQDADCRLALGAPCTLGPQCKSGFCSDGVCCTAACNQACETCSGAQPGTCTAVPVDESDPGTCAAPRICLQRMGCAAIDQTQMGWSGGNASIVSQSHAQTFRMGRAARLLGVRLQLECPPGAVVTVDVTDTIGGQPGDQTLATATVTSKGMPFSLTTFKLETPPRLNANQVAAIKMRALGDCKTSMYGGFEMIDPYPRGARFTRGGQGWIDMRDDMVFQTLIEP